MGKNRRGWSYSAGERGRNRVRAYEDVRSGILLLEFYERRFDDPTPKRKRVSLGHRDRQRAKRQADEAAAAFARTSQAPTTQLTLGSLFDMYLGEVTPTKGESKQRHDRSTAEMLLRFWGRERKVETLSKREWTQFVQARRQGQVSPRGSGKRGGVGPRTIEYDLKFAIAAFNWATEAHFPGSREPLLTRNPFKGFHLPGEESPRRPMCGEERYQKMLQAAQLLDWRVGVALVLTHETGHRIGAVRRLQWNDVDLGNARIRWSAEKDKIGLEHDTPITPTAVRALERAREENPGIGTAWVLPSPGNSSEPCSRHLLRDWWKKIEEQAGLEHVERMGWHSLRRKFATEMKETPLKDLAYLGGWKTEVTILKCYQQPDEETMRSAFARRKRVSRDGGQLEPIDSRNRQSSSA
jgi:integrase